MKVLDCVLLVSLGLALSAPPVARADTGAAQSKAQTNSTKSMKAFKKHQKQQRSKTLKSEKKAQKNLRKLHPEMRR